MPELLIFRQKQPLPTITTIHVEISVSIQIKDFMRVGQWLECDTCQRREPLSFLIKNDWCSAFIGHATDVQETVPVDIPNPWAVVSASQVA